VPHRAVGQQHDAECRQRGIAEGKRAPVRRPAVGDRGGDRDGQRAEELDRDRDAERDPRERLVDGEVHEAEVDAERGRDRRVLPGPAASHVG
jgi:hypothetical protein